MALTRRMLKELGLEEESIEKILAEHGRVIEGMTTKAQAEEDKKNALDEFQKKWEKEHPQIEVKETDAYKELETKYNNMVFDAQIKSAKVKDKYVDIVKSKISHDEPFEDAIKKVKDEYSEFFESDEPANPPKGGEPKPTVGAKTPKEEGGEPTEADKIKAQFGMAFKR